MQNPVGYFEIPVSHLDRAIAFYEKVFGNTLEKGEIDGNAMAFFPSDNDKPGISGALAQGDSYIPGHQGVRIYFHVDNIDTTLENAGAAGGKVLYPKTSIGELGWVAEFEDSEGNCIALHCDA
jgi:uncharacterized protein